MAIRGVQTAEYPVDQIDTVQRFDFGTELTLSSGVYVYVKGVASAAAGKWCTYNPSTGVTALTVADAVGMVGIYMSTIDAATEFGWIQVVGLNTIADTGTIAANAMLYATATAGRVDDAAVAGDLVVNAVSCTADTSNVATVYLARPSLTNVSN